MRLLASLGLALLAGCSGKSAPPAYLSRSALRDPTTCRGCHPNHYADWSGSMHAYASDDPVFRAMNARGQRETDGGLGSFCLQCHAPIAFSEGATFDGLNLDSIPAQLHGVTCFYCHSIDQVQGLHNDLLHLADDNVLRGGIATPFANDAHASAYSPLLDGTQLGSSAMCGSCHDVVTNYGAPIERTYSEWQASAYDQPTGQACGSCHLGPSEALEPVSAVTGSPARHYHGHAMAAVDRALFTGFPQEAEQTQLIQSFLATALQDAVCVSQQGASSTIQVILDNVGSGHGWPSGATQDRRAWVEVEAYAEDGGALLYASGAVLDGGTPTELGTADPDLWLLRDCMFDTTGTQVAMFWNAATVESNELPAPPVASADGGAPPMHIAQVYPGAGRTLGDTPGRVDVRVRLQPIGLDVLGSLVQSGDLDAGYLAAMPTFDLPGTELAWTPATATVSYVDPVTQVAMSCVALAGFDVQAPTAPAAKHLSCAP